MTVLLLGATGLIGSAVATALAAAGHRIVAVARRPPSTRIPAAHWLRLDINDMTGPEAWLPHLDGVDVVVNCAGILQEGGGDSPARIHRDAPIALFAACERAGVRRVIHVSAANADRDSRTEFLRTKYAAELDLQARDLDWVILRPVIVVGRSAFGGSAMFRGLASLPVLPRLRNGGVIQIVQLEEVAATIVALTGRSDILRTVLELAHPQRFTLEEVVARYRVWLGWSPARLISLPAGALALAARLGDFAGLLGWRPALRTTALREMERGTTGDPATWIQATGFAPRSLDEALAAEPSSVQERWFARLYLLKPIVFGTFAAFWIGSGLISLGPGWAAAEGLMREGGAGQLSGAGLMAGAFADLAIGLALLFRRTARLGLLAALAVSLFYTVAATFLLPHLWADPLGPIVKIWPIMLLSLLALAILEER